MGARLPCRQQFRHRQLDLENLVDSSRIALFAALKTDRKFANAHGCCIILAGRLQETGRPPRIQRVRSSVATRSSDDHQQYSLGISQWNSLGLSETVSSGLIFLFVRVAQSGLCSLPRVVRTLRGQ